MMYRFPAIVAVALSILTSPASAESGCAVGVVQAELADGTEVPYSKLQVYLFKDGVAGHLIGQDVSDEEGSFTFRDLESGEYLLKIALPFEESLIAAEQIVHFDGGHCGKLPAVSIPPPSVVAKAGYGARRLEGAGGRRFHPISLFGKGYISYAVSEPGSEVYLFDRASTLFRKIGELKTSATVSDHCLLEFGETSYIISASHSSGLMGAWRSYLLVTPLASFERLLTQEARRKISLRFGRYHGIFCDSNESAVYLTDPVKQEIYRAQVTIRGTVGSEEHVFSIGGNLQPVSIAKHDNVLFVGVRGHSNILRIDLDDRSQTEIGRDPRLLPLGLTVSADSRRLLFGDVNKKSVMAYDLGTRTMSTIIDRSSGLDFPAAIRVDSDGTLLVADPHETAVFEARKVLKLGTTE